jgi:hypothetical protein
MKSNSKRNIIILVTILVLVATACNLPVSGVPGNQPGAVYTQAAETIMAQLTYSVVETFVAQKTEEAKTPLIPTDVPPTATLTQTLVPPTATNTPVPPTYTPRPLPCDWAQYVSDVTIEDGTIVKAGEGFYKTWRLKNIGTCTWTTDYDLIYSYGDRMEGNKSIPLSYNVPPGRTIDVAVFLRAPEEKGYYKGYWKLRDENGNTFGIGPDYNGEFWVQIQVKHKATSYDTPFDFVANYCLAQWSNDTHLLPCPGNSSSLGGFVIKLKNPTLEKGGTDDEPALWTHPEFIKNGSIIGEYPPILIKDGDYLVTTLGCLKEAANCNVMFSLSYSADGGAITSLGSWTEVYDKTLTYLNIDLSSLKGKNVVFYFTVDANGTYKDDDAFWLGPAIRN